MENCGIVDLVCEAENEFKTYDLIIVFDEENYMRFNLGFLGDCLKINSIDIFKKFKKFYVLGDDFIKISGYVFFNNYGLLLYDFIEKIDLKSVKNEKQRKIILSILACMVNFIIKGAYKHNNRN